MLDRFLQLYSVKEALAEDFVGTLVKVREMGYTGVEFAGNYGNYDAMELKHMITSLGMKILGGHVKTPDIPAKLDFAAEAGFKYLTDPWYVMGTEAEALAAAKDFNKMGALCKEKGLKFAYHNHRHEFAKAGDKYLLELVIENTDPALVDFQLDVGWVAYSGVCPVEILNKYPGRFPLIHVKECGYVFGEGPDNDDWNVKIGTGIVDWAAVKKAAIAQGTQYFVIEREHPHAGDIIAACAEDCDFLKNL